MLENFDPNERDENQRNNNEEIISGALDLSGDILTDMADGTKENAAEVTDAAEDIEIMSIQDIADELADGAANMASDIMDDVIDGIFDIFSD